MPPLRERLRDAARQGASTASERLRTGAQTGVGRTRQAQQRLRQRLQEADSEGVRQALQKAAERVEVDPTTQPRAQDDADAMFRRAEETAHAGPPVAASLEPLTRPQGMGAFVTGGGGPGSPSEGGGEPPSYEKVVDDSDQLQYLKNQPTGQETMVLGTKQADGNWRATAREGGRVVTIGRFDTKTATRQAMTRWMRLNPHGLDLVTGGARGVSDSPGQEHGGGMADLVLGRENRERESADELGGLAPVGDPDTESRGMEDLVLGTPDEAETDVGWPTLDELVVGSTTRDASDDMLDFVLGRGGDGQ